MFLQLGLTEASLIPVILNEYIQFLEAANSASNSPLINSIIEILRKLTGLLVHTTDVSLYDTISFAKFACYIFSFQKMSFTGYGCLDILIV